MIEKIRTYIGAFFIFFGLMILPEKIRNGIRANFEQSTYQLEELNNHVVTKGKYDA